MQDLDICLTIPYEVTADISSHDYKTRFTEEFISDNEIGVIELPYWDKKVQKYHLPVDKEKFAYELRADFDEDNWCSNDRVGPSILYIIPWDDPSKEYIAVKK